jgi:hypothetical protein
VKEGPALYEVDQGRASRCWLEKHPDRREEVRRATGAYEAATETPDTPAERFHQATAPAHPDAPPEPGPPYTPPRPLMADPDVEEDVER